MTTPQTTGKVRAIPPYILDIYKKQYMERRRFYLLDSDWFAYVSTFFAYGRIKKSILAEIKPSDSVLMIGNCYGWLIKDIAGKLGSKGTFTIVDTVPMQVQNAKDKLSPWPQFKAELASGTDYLPDIPQKYDKIVCYFLLHELPDKTKKSLLTHTLGLLSDEGKLILADYSVPFRHNYLAKLVHFFARISEPFAESLSQLPISAFVPSHLYLKWHTKKFLWGLYGVTTATEDATDRKD